MLDSRRTATQSCRTTEACARSSTPSGGGSRSTPASRREGRPEPSYARTRGCIVSETCRRRGLATPLKLVLASQHWLRGCVVQVDGACAARNRGTIVAYTGFVKT
eukprot:scaffold111481_cov57-Phaeocystis_antarctica.AAC.1